MNSKLLLTLAFVLAFAIAVPAAFAQSANGNGAGGSPDNGQGGQVTTGGSGGQPADTGGGGPPADTGSGNGNGGGGETTAGNNLSFPAVAADGFGITAVSTALFATPYDGPYTGLTDEDIAALAGHTWYAQKTDGNVWQAAYRVNPVGTPVHLYGVDWGDNVEAVDPLLGQPFRLEVTLYEKLTEPLAGYTMRVLANPSSPDEAQGTNTTTYPSDFATVASNLPKLDIQYLGDTPTTGLVWNGSAWTRDGDILPFTTVTFGPELNVAGKYVYGAAEGGWRPVQTGTYRLTMRFPASDISLTDAVIGNYADWAAGTETTTEEETGAAKPVIDTANNITYVDVTVVDRHEGRTPENPGGTGGEEATTPTTDTAATATVTTAPEATTTNGPTCTDYLTDYLGQGRTNNPTQVTLLQKFLNETVGTKIPLTGYFGAETAAGVSKFQTTYADDVLQPWVDAGYTDVSLTRGTGYAGVTTIAKINSLQCK